MRVLRMILISGLLAAWLGAGCGRTELEMRGWVDHDGGRPPTPDAADDGSADLPPDGDPDAPTDGDPDVPPDGDPDTLPDAEPDVPPFVGLSCMSAAMCALCCGSDYGCMLGCVNEADPSERGTLMGIVTCVLGAGCGGIGGAPDLPCLLEECGEEINSCAGGPGGTGGCLSLAWCLVSSGCTGAEGCEDQGFCYQGCFGAARPEVMGAARELVLCMAGDCMMDCASGLTSTECLLCLGRNCLISLRGCIGL